MDMKAAARSKRAQSQRGKSKFSARHSHSQSRQQQKKNEDVQEENAQIGVGEPYEQLPSNWGRYEEPHSSGSEGEDPHKLKEEESVAVKSKGADYLYLLSQSQNPSTFDAHLPDSAEMIERGLRQYFPRIDEHPLLRGLRPPEEQGSSWERAAWARDLIAAADRRIAQLEGETRVMWAMLGVPGSAQQGGPNGGTARIRTSGQPTGDSQGSRHSSRQRGGAQQRGESSRRSQRSRHE